MSEVLVAAYTVHASPGRLRIRIPEKRGDASYFANLRSQLSEWRQVLEVGANAVTSGVLLRLAPGVAPAEIVERARALGLFDLRVAPLPPATRRESRSLLKTASAGFSGMDRLIAEGTGGYLDLKSSIFFVLLALAARQIVRGHFMVPGLTLLWYALSMMLA